jgi:hypothetical protein
MDDGHLIRRLVHLATPLFLVYYFLPDPLWLNGLSKSLGLVLFLFVALAAEAVRLKLSWNIVGMREYESRRMSAAAWTAIGLTFAFLLFPFWLVAPAVMGMAFIDPLIGELRLRKSNLYPAVPTVAYFVLVFAVLGWLRGPDAVALLAAFFATVLAIAFEKQRWKYFDDDFLMIVVPLLGMTMIYLLTSSPF